MRGGGAEARYLHLDVTSEADWKRAIEYSLDEFGRLDALVNNAGSVVRIMIEDMPEEAWDAELSVHAKGVFLGTKHAIPALRQGGGARSSTHRQSWALWAARPHPPTRPPRARIRLFTKTAALQYAEENIRVNSIHPGFAVTPLTEKDFSEPELRASLIARTPLGRLGTAEDIAHGILYLASDEAAFVTGSELVIDGGTIAQ